jgi:hypothetical protein
VATQHAPWEVLGDDENQTIEFSQDVKTPPKIDGRRDIVVPDNMPKAIHRSG